MKLRDWRQSKKHTLQQMSDAFGLANASVYQRYESGMHRMDAPLVEAIVTLTGGAVTAQDMHEARLEWLQARGRGGVSMPARLPDAGGAVCENRNPKVSRGRRI